MQSYLAKFIARRRTAMIEEQYKAIGGGSPIHKWTSHQNGSTCALLDTMSPRTGPHKAYTAFRYVEPSTEQMYKQLLQDGIKRAVAFSQYPQYSCSTTGSSLNELCKWRSRLDGDSQIEWSVIDRWPTHPGLIEAFAENIKRKLDEYPASVRSSVVLLFSAHSLPMSVVNKGKCGSYRVGLYEIETQIILTTYQATRILPRSERQCTQ